MTTHDPTAADDKVRVEDLTLEDAAADVAAFLEGVEEIDGLIVGSAAATGRTLTVVLEDAHDVERTFHLRVDKG